jgi:hypothetical protein
MKQYEGCRKTHHSYLISHISPLKSHLSPLTSQTSPLFSRYETLRWYLEIIGLDFEEVIKVVNKIPKLYPI